LGEGRAALDFPLRSAPSLSISEEVRLLASIRQTAARQGVDEILYPRQRPAARDVSGPVALPQTLEQ
jgi:hypothetical protein